MVDRRKPRPPAPARRRKFYVSHEALHDLLGLPLDTTLVHVDSGIADGHGMAIVFVENPAWEPVPEGAVAPVCEPVFGYGDGVVPMLTNWGAVHGSVTD